MTYFTMNEIPRLRFAPLGMTVFFCHPERSPEVTRSVYFRAKPRDLLLFLAALALGAGTPARAYDSPGCEAPIPEHGAPWVETRELDPRTVFLWKFSSEKDQAADLEDMIEADEWPALTQSDDAELFGISIEANRPRPKLSGAARAEADIGRFGGGLALDGAGYAEGAVALKGLLGGDGGFTLDFWFRGETNLVAHLVMNYVDKAQDKARDKDETILLSIPDYAGKPLMAAAWSGGTSVVFTVAGAERLRVPVPNTTDGWHHLALVIGVSEGKTDGATLSLTVDGTTVSAERDRPDPMRPIPWFAGLPARLGSKLYVGGAPERPGLRGAVDEARLTKGVKYLYPWHLGRQELERPRESVALKSPFFRPGKALTRFTFDGTLKPEAFAGLSWTGDDKAAEFRRGVQGQALDLTRVGRSGFALNGYYILPDASRTNGTIELWFRPLDWHNFYRGGYRGEGIKYLHLADLCRKGASTSSRYIEVRQGRAGQDGDGYWEKIHPGTWTHFLMVMSGGNQTIYLNGRTAQIYQGGCVTYYHIYARQPVEKWMKETGGKDDGTWVLAFRSSPTLVDEFSVYDWGMSAEEAWNAYARWLPDAKERMKPLPAFRIQLDYYAHSWNLKEKFVASVGCLPVGEESPASADCEIRNSAGAVLFTSEKQPLSKAGGVTFTFAQALPFDRYEVTVRSRNGKGAVLKQEQRESVREKPAWFGNTLGEERTVPDPWTPITVKQRMLGVIGREIELGGNGLPARIATLGEPVLAAPAVVRADGVELTGTGPTFGETAPDRVEWTAELTGGNLKAGLEAWLEFDGLIYCAITLKLAAGVETTIEDLDVDFPLQPAAATQLIANGGGNDFRYSWIATPVPPGKGSVWNCLSNVYPVFCRAEGVANFMPHMWLGADERGLYFGAESDRGWTVDGPKPAQEVLRDERSVVFRMNVIREPTVIPAAGRRFHFVLLPTPAKPEPPDWRYQMLAGGVNFGSCDTFGGFDLKDSGNVMDLEPRSWEHAAKMAPQCRAKWGRCILYTDASWPGLGPGFRDWKYDMSAGTGRTAWTPEFEDYAVWAVNEFIQRGLIDGIYWDDVSVGYTYSLASTAYEYAGSKNGRRVGFTALAQRRVNKRLWRLFQAAGKEPGIWAHMTVCYEVPIFSFCRYLSNCEFVTGVEFPGKRDAMDQWSPETLRILGGSAKWGVGYHNLTTLPRALPEGAAAEQWAYPQRRAETALYLTSDQMNPADGLGQVLVREKVFDGPARAYPWWKADEVLKVTAPTNAQALACVYALEGRAIAIVANRDRGGEHEFGLELEAKAFPWAAQGVAWRDLDPGLEPPASVVAGAEEINAALATMGSLLEKDQELDATALTDLMEGSTPEERALQRLELRVEGDTARVVVRPRDYRVLEARPR